MKMNLSGLFLAAFLVVVICAGAGAASADQIPRTLAILPFENNSVTDPERYAPLTKGLSAMLITDLSKSGSKLKLIERGKIQALLEEIALGQTGCVDESTAIRAGNILGAQTIAFGSFMVLGNQVRIDTRIIRVETSELIMAESIDGDSGNFINLERKLAEKIAGSLKVAFRSETSASGSDIDAALYFSRGLDALDRGDREEANRLFKKSMELDPAYKKQVAGVQGMN
jgi:TolB-like protein